jgi:hypothetical protein
MARVVLETAMVRVCLAWIRPGAILAADHDHAAGLVWDLVVLDPDECYC